MADVYLRLRDSSYGRGLLSAPLKLAISPRPWHSADWRVRRILAHENKLYVCLSDAEAASVMACYAIDRSKTRAPDSGNRPMSWYRGFEIAFVPFSQVL